MLLENALDEDVHFFDENRNVGDFNWREINKKEKVDFESKSGIYSSESGQLRQQQKRDRLKGALPCLAMGMEGHFSASENPHR